MEFTPENVAKTRSEAPLYFQAQQEIDAMIASGTITLNHSGLRKDEILYSLCCNLEAQGKLRRESAQFRFVALEPA